MFVVIVNLQPDPKGYNIIVIDFKKRSKFLSHILLKKGVNVWIIGNARRKSMISSANGKI